MDSSQCGRFGQPGRSALFQLFAQIAEISTMPNHPQSEHKRQSRERVPGLPEVDYVVKRLAGTLIARSPITMTASAVLSKTETPSGNSSTRAGRM